MSYFKVLIFSLLFPFLLKSQSIQVNQASDSQTNLSAEELVKEVLLNGGACSSIEWIETVENPGGKQNLSQRSWGYFKKENSNFPFKEGIVLSSSYAQNIGQSPNKLANDYNNSWDKIGDDDLKIISGEKSLNATAFKFKFIPKGNTISFNYIFASEEYGNSSCSEHHQYLDAFVFLISGPGITNDAGLSGKNIALIPNTNIPISIGNVYNNSSCSSPSSANPEYYDLANFKSPDFIYNGRTKVLTASTDVQANQEYTIKLVVSDAYNGKYDSAVFLEASSFNIGSTFENVDTGEEYNKELDLCEKESVNIKINTALIKPTFQWYKNGMLILNATSKEYLLSDAGLYKVIVTGTDCTDEVELQVNPIISPIITDQELINCSYSPIGNTVFNLSDANDLFGINTNWTFTYFQNIKDAQADSNPLNNNYQNKTNPEIIIVKVRNEMGCASYANLTLKADINQIQKDKLEECGSNGIAIFNLKLVETKLLNPYPKESWNFYLNLNDALLDINKLNPIYQNISPNQKIYAKVSNQCTLAEVSLIVNDKPDLSKVETKHFLCLNGKVSLTAGKYSSYIWKDGQNTESIEVSKIGSYHLVVTDSFGCESEITFTVENSLIPEIKNIALIKNGLLVEMVTPGDYQYSLDNNNWQNTPTFTNIGPGKYTIYAKDLKGCSTVSVTKIISGIPNVFTPNGDGFNDYWDISNIENSKGASIRLFDRYGKMLLFKTVDNCKWDATYLGNPVPQGDYWYIIKFQNGEQLLGNISVLRN